MSEHDLDVWLADIGKTRGWLAEKLNTTEASLSRLVNGKQWAHRDFFAGLRKLSGGRLTADNFLPPVKFRVPPPTKSRERAGAA